jgi:hypothetical protein
MPVAKFLILTVAPDRALPWGSSMVPEIVPLVACPNTSAPHNMTLARVKNIARLLDFITVLLELFSDYAIPSFQPIRYLYIYK